jgi:hypothetical protein
MLGRFSVRYASYEDWQSAQNRRYGGRAYPPYFYYIRNAHIRNPLATLDELRRHKKKEIWLLMTLEYHGDRKIPNSWFIDLIQETGPYVGGGRAVFLEQLRYCKDYLARAINYVLKNHVGITSTQWELDFISETAYPHLDDVLDSLGVQIVGDWQKEGIEQENLSIRRVQYLADVEDRYRQENRRL